MPILLSSRSIQPRLKDFEVWECTVSVKSPEGGSCPRGKKRERIPWIDHCPQRGPATLNDDDGISCAARRKRMIRTASLHAACYRCKVKAVTSRNSAMSVQ